MRLFTALTLADEILDRLERLQDALHVGRAVLRENLHLTLVFLGDVPDARIEAVHDALLTVHSDPFILTLAGAGSFGAPGATSVWIGVRPSPQLERLQRKVQSALHGAGMAPSRQRFRPHVTLARIPRGVAGSGDAAELARALSVWGAVALPPMVVDGFSLFRSTLLPEAPLHDELARYPFGQTMDFDA